MVNPKEMQGLVYHAAFNFETKCRYTMTLEIDNKVSGQQEIT